MDTPGKRSQQQERAARLAEALRQNLKRRKTQARARSTGTPAADTAPDGEPRPDGPGSRLSPQSQPD